MSGAHEASDHVKDTPALETKADETIPNPSDSSVGAEKPTQ
jgi:hypothetical protein